MAEITGMIYDIQGFSVNDGPGIRTTVFLKGCPLRCPWCHSPESQKFYPQLSWISMRCVGTELCQERCIKACPKNAIELGSTGVNSATQQPVQYVHVKRDLCDNCGDCAEVCYPDALYLCGEDWTIDRLVTRLVRDKPFFREGGGVTVSGGECLCQPEFTTELLKRLKAAEIHTAVDTTGFVRWEIIERILPYTDLFLYDLKHMDSAKHKVTVGVPNELILENAQKIAAAGGRLQIRIPVIPLFNHDEANIRATAEFCLTLGDAVTEIQLLPYHSLGAMKYLRISDATPVEATPPTDEYMQKLQKIFEEYGLKVRIH